MRSLADLLASTEGRSFLEARGVFTTAEALVERLRPPSRSGLHDLLGLGPQALSVYTAHQVKLDYAPSVTAKIRTARDLHIRHPGVVVVFLWLDMDRAGADKRTVGIQLRGRGGSLQFRLVSRRHDDKEIRFVPVGRADLEEALRRLGAWARQHGARAAERHASLSSELLRLDPSTLAEVNLALTSLLLRDHLSVDSPSAVVSHLAARGLLTESLDEVVDRIDDVVTVFNGAVDSLIAADVDPQVRPLGPDYLPLHYSCDRDDRRSRLRHERRGADHFAVTTCECGTVYRFHLGAGSLSISELARTGRWSTDVTLPMYLNDLASGVVAGQSSALYGLVLNEVLEKVLARRPIPMLVPEDLSRVPSGRVAFEAGATGSILAEYLAG